MTKPKGVEKSGLHPRNKHRSLYDFAGLIKSSPKLAEYVLLNKYNNESIDFADPKAVMALNKALLKHFYAIDHWDIPKGYLCPPIPGRADYIHCIADVLASFNGGRIPHNNVKCLDIGVGANCVYPIIANKEYGWSVVGTDIDEAAIRSAKKIITSNSDLAKVISVRLQKNPSHIFKGIIREGETFDVSICNPPFHASLAEAKEGTMRKINNLRTKKSNKVVLNFGGQNAELWCKGGELGFVKQIIRESTEISRTCFLFSSLISKSSHLREIYKVLKGVNATEVRTIEMTQGNKISRIVVWSFMDKVEQKEWRQKHWC